MVQKSYSIEEIREILGSFRGVNTIIIIRIIIFYSMSFSYNQAIQLNPKKDSAWYNKGRALDNLEKY